MNVTKLVLPVLHPLRISLRWENPIILRFKSFLEVFNLYMFVSHNTTTGLLFAFCLSELATKGRFMFAIVKEAVDQIPNNSLIPLLSVCFLDWNSCSFVSTIRCVCQLISVNNNNFHHCTFNTRKAQSSLYCFALSGTNIYVVFPV